MQHVQAYPCFLNKKQPKVLLLILEKDASPSNLLYSIIKFAGTHLKTLAGNQTMIV